VQHVEQPGRPHGVEERARRADLEVDRGPRGAQRDGRGLDAQRGRDGRGLRAVAVEDRDRAARRAERHTDVGVAPGAGQRLGGEVVGVAVGAEEEDLGGAAEAAALDADDRAGADGAPRAVGPAADHAQLDGAAGGRDGGDGLLRRGHGGPAGVLLRRGGRGGEEHVCDCQAAQPYGRPRVRQSAP
jgi:hypothetical protein